MVYEFRVRAVGLLGPWSMWFRRWCVVTHHMRHVAGCCAANGHTAPLCMKSTWCGALFWPQCVT